MRRRFPQHKEPDCPAIILFRYSDRQTIRIFEASGEDNYTAYFCKEPLVSGAMTTLCRSETRPIVNGVNILCSVMLFMAF